MSDQTTGTPDLTILILCLNEEKSIADCVQKARDFLKRNTICGEVLVADNNSEDQSAAVAEAAGARVICVPNRGNGNAIIGGIEAALGRFVILGDGDGEHDFSSLELFWEKLQSGYDFVIGNRFWGTSRLDARPFLRRFGNSLLSGIGKLFLRFPVGDFHCGLRAFRVRNALALSLQCPGVEIASEMIIKAVQRNMRITEVPVTMCPATDPDRLSHLRPWRDGWRHLRLLLMLSPRWLFLYPGCIFLAVGLIIVVKTTVSFGEEFGAYTMLYGSAFVICGLQAVLFSLLAKTFCESIGLSNSTSLSARLQKTHVLETGLATSLVLALLGAAGSVWSIFVWAQTVGIDLEARLQIAIPSVTLLIAGVQIGFFSFLLALIGTHRPSGDQ